MTHSACCSVSSDDPYSSLALEHPSPRYSLCSYLVSVLATCKCKQCSAFVLHCSQYNVLHKAHIMDTRNICKDTQVHLHGGGRSLESHIALTSLFVYLSFLSPPQKIASFAFRKFFNKMLNHCCLPVSFLIYLSIH